MTRTTIAKKTSENVLEEIKAYEKYLETQFKRKQTLLEKKYAEKKEQLRQEDEKHQEELEKTLQKTRTKARENAQHEAEKIINASRRKAKRLKQKVDKNKSELAEQFIKRFVNQ
ncbi:MAG: hypothetical protein ACLFTH_04180 [Candidatus Woesearchaeota archaeon]